MTITGYRTKREIAATLLRNAIVHGELAPGTRLIAEDLSQSYQISMTPIREALSLLESEGLVTQLPHRGAVVAALDRDELLELYAVRGAVEALATLHGVPRLGSADLAAMADVLAQLETFDGSWDVFLDIDMSFHRVLYRAAGSQRWTHTIETLWLRSRRYMLASASAEGAADALHADHRAILDACRHGDAARAADEMRAHLHRSEARLLEQWR